MTATDSTTNHGRPREELTMGLRDYIQFMDWILGARPTSGVHAESSHFCVDGALADMLKMVFWNYDDLHELGWTERPFQGTIRVLVENRLVLSVHFSAPSEGPFDDVAGNKSAVIERTGEASSRLAIQVSYAMRADDFMFEGGVSDEDLTVSISGFEAPVDAYLSNVGLRFLLMHRNFVLGVTQPALSVKRFGDTILADDVVGQLLHSKLPRRAKECFPNVLHEPSGASRNAIAAWYASQG